MIVGDGGGSVGPGGAVAGARSGYDGFSYDDTVTAYYHWCYHDGHLWDAYELVRPGLLPTPLRPLREGRVQLRLRPVGARLLDRFSISKWVGLSWHTSATACVAVDGWRNVWAC